MNWMLRATEQALETFATGFAGKFTEGFAGAFSEVSREQRIMRALLMASLMASL